MKGNAGMRGGRGSAGGGIRSNKNVSVGVRTGAAATGVRPAAVAQYGSSVGNKATGQLALQGIEARSIRPPHRSLFPLGNEVARNVGGGGPGKGREVMRSGAQGVHGPVNPGAPNPGAKRPIFPGFK